MIYLTMILGAIAIGLGVGRMSKQEPERSYRPPKKPPEKKDDDFWDYAWS